MEGIAWHSDLKAPLHWKEYMFIQSMKLLENQKMSGLRKNAFKKTFNFGLCAFQGTGGTASCRRKIAGRGLGPNLRWP